MLFQFAGDSIVDSMGDICSISGEIVGRLKDVTKSTREAQRDLETLLEGLESGVIGQRDLIRGLVLGLLAQGHVLIEGVPGLGKTRAVNRLAKLCKVRFKRLQFTPDLLPADILGTRIYNQHAAEFETVRGPIFSNFVLADEINRAPAKVQSALLETMQERQVTIGLQSHKLQAPFQVFATQNPIEQEGTYPLPEAQLDRFLFKWTVTYPEHSDEQEVVKLVIDEAASPQIDAMFSDQDILAWQSAVREVFVETRVIRYATELVQATRYPEAAGLKLGRFIRYGASPRGSIALIQGGRAHAFLDGRQEVRPGDIKAVAHGALRHRILTTYYADAEGVTSDQIVDQILQTVKVP